MAVQASGSAAMLIGDLVTFSIRRSVLDISNFRKPNALSTLESLAFSKRLVWLLARLRDFKILLADGGWRPLLSNVDWCFEFWKGQMIFYLYSEKVVPEFVCRQWFKRLAVQTFEFSLRSGQNKLFWLIRLQILLERPLFVDWFGCNWLCRDSRLIRENLFQLRHFSGASQALGRWNRLSKCGRRQALSIRSLDVAVLPPEFRIEIPDHFY